MAILSLRTVRTLSAILYGAIALALAGCSSKVTGPQTQSATGQTVAITVSVRPGLPQDSGYATANASAQTGDNTLIVNIHDLNTNAPIADANVTAAPSSSLIDQQATESGRSQGNGVYWVPIRFGVPDDYKVEVDVQRPGQRFPETFDFNFTVSQ